METIKFKQTHGKYNINEVAGFEDIKAQKLVNSGVAEFYPRKKSKMKPKVDKMVNAAENKLTLDDLESKPGGYYYYDGKLIAHGKDDAKKWIEDKEG